MTTPISATKRPPSFAATVRLILFTLYAACIVAWLLTSLATIPIAFTLFIISLFNLVATPVEIARNKHLTTLKQRVSQYASIVLSLIAAVYGALCMYIVIFEVFTSNQV